MGRVRTKTVKNNSRKIIERFYSRMTNDFHTNKKVIDEIAIIASKRLRNKIAGFSTHLMKRIQKGPVRGISLKLQEEERERRMDFVPEESAIKIDQIAVDKETLEMLTALGMGDCPGVKVETVEAAVPLAYAAGRGGPKSRFHTQWGSCSTRNKKMESLRMFLGRWLNAASRCRDLNKNSVCKVFKHSNAGGDFYFSFKRSGELNTTSYDELITIAIEFAEDEYDTWEKESIHLDI